MKAGELTTEMIGRHEKRDMFPVLNRTDSRPRTTSGLLPFQGAWNIPAASHLLNRSLFGPTRGEILAASSGSLNDLLNQLLDPQPPPSIPPDPNVPGRDWTTAPFSDIAQINYQYDVALKEWWLQLILKQGVSLREKMTLFLHNHFASQGEVVRDARFMYRQNALFRTFAFGNLRELVQQITLDPAMLRYLNGYVNKIPVPDENYARELLELFTIGKGGGGVAYTEDDVRSAARALTGWTVDRYQNPPTPYFNERNHDPGKKEFSETFDNAIIDITRNPDGSVNGHKEVSDLIDMIFRHPETAKSFCRKLYRWFVYYNIDEAAETNVIGPLADVMRTNNYELRPVLNVLLGSEHFFDVNNVGCVIKNPLDFIVGTARQFLIPYPGGTSPEDPVFVRHCRHMVETMGIDLFEPPNVAGWPAYHQAPGFYAHWINTTTLPARKNFAESLVYGIRPNGTSAMFSANVFNYAKDLQDPGNPFSLVDQVIASLLPPIRNGSPLTPEQRDYLMYHVMQLVRNDEYEWTVRWNRFAADPGNQEASMIVGGTLRSLLRYVMQMSEFQLM